MIVVSDTTPIRYLIEIDKINILKNLFGRILVLYAVITELQHEKTPQAVKEWLDNPPDWFEIHYADVSIYTPQKKIGNGEREAFALAITFKADAVLLDDRGAMVEARRLNIQIIPTFVVLAEAAERRLINFIETVEQLRRTTFRLPPQEDITAILKRIIANSGNP